jgi:predicted GIY-YIG superfamily endonuclease
VLGRGVYVLNFDEAITPRQLRHYVGWTKNLPNRLFDHYYLNSGANLAKHARRLEVGWTVSLVIADGSQRDERLVKTVTGSRCCPLCAGSSLLTLVQSPSAVEVRRIHVQRLREVARAHVQVLIRT